MGDSGERVDYDEVAPRYDRRYVEQRYTGIEAALRDFVARGPGDGLSGGAVRVLEVGCGTGQWLRRMLDWGCHATGLDPSLQMLTLAAQRAPEARIVRGRAERLPFPSASFDRVIAVNAIHHFDDGAAFAREAARVLRPGGRVVSMALDPARGRDDWYVYDYFARTRELDLARYPTAERIAAFWRDAGLGEPEAFVAEHMQIEAEAESALSRGLITPTSTSQLTLLSEEEFDAGIAAIRAASTEARARGEALTLVADLRIYASAARKP